MDIAIFSATQRCGSTLVQRIFNLHPRTLVWGECGRFPDIFHALLEATSYWSQSGAAEREQYFKNSKPVDLFIANMAPEQQVAVHAIQHALSTFCKEMFHRAPYTRFGFKEVNISPGAVELFRSTFPDCTSVFLSRDPWESWRSLPRVWGISIDQFSETWVVNTSHYMLQRNFFWYEDVVALGPGLARLCELAQIEEVTALRALHSVVGSTHVAEKNSKTEMEKSTLIETIRLKANSTALRAMQEKIAYL